MTERNRQYLLMMEDLFRAAGELKTKIFIWGGLSLDIRAGEFLREHGDLDAFAENLEEKREELAAVLHGMGYETEYIDEFSMLEIRRGLVHATLNPLKINGKIAEWKHIGNQGSVYFPAAWLDDSPRTFCGVQAYTAGIRFEYAVKTKVSMLHPTWQLREKDHMAIAQMKKELDEMRIAEEDIYPWIWSYNPYWFHRGYEEFFRPTFAWPIEPK